MDELMARTQEVLESEGKLEQLRRCRNSKRASFFFALFTLCCIGAVWFQQYDAVFLSTIFLGIGATFSLFASDANGLSREIGERSWNSAIPRFSKRRFSSTDEGGDATPLNSHHPTPGGVGSTHSSL